MLSCLICARSPIALVPFAVAVAAYSLAVGPGARAQDARAGQRIFQSQCSICHSPRPGQNIVGPSLFGVIDRHSGSTPNFHYSSANARSGLTWDPATLDRYLTSPQQVVPGTLMTFPGLKDPLARANVIAFLATLR
jgi:cytochrome c